MGTRLELAAELLADELDHPNRAGMILVRSEEEGHSVFTTEVDSRLLATIAQAMDENPVLIGLFLTAAWMVQKEGLNKNDPAFRRVIFVSGGIQ